MDSNTCEEFDLKKYIDCRHKYIDLSLLENELLCQMDLLNTINSGIYKIFNNYIEDFASILDKHSQIEKEVALLETYRREFQELQSLVNSASCISIPQDIKQSNLSHVLDRFADDMSIFITPSRHLLFDVELKNGEHEIIGILTTDKFILGISKNNDSSSASDKYDILNVFENSMLDIRVDRTQVTLRCNPVEYTFWGDANKLNHLRMLFQECVEGISEIDPFECTLTTPADNLLLDYILYTSNVQLLKDNMREMPVIKIEDTFRVSYDNVMELLMVVKWQNNNPIEYLEAYSLHIVTNRMCQVSKYNNFLYVIEQYHKIVSKHLDEIMLLFMQFEGIQSKASFHFHIKRIVSEIYIKRILKRLFFRGSEVSYVSGLVDYVLKRTTFCGCNLEYLFTSVIDGYKRFKKDFMEGSKNLITETIQRQLECK